MYTQHISVMENTLTRAREMASTETMAANMFSIFFLQYPEAERYFRDYDMNKLGPVKFNVMAATIVDSLKFPDFADNYIPEEVYRHRTVHELKDREYYFGLIDALIESLKLTLDSYWNAELERYWQESVATMKHSIDRELHYLKT